MRTLLPNTALLIFIRSASLEARQKPLAFRKKNAQKLAQLLNDQVLNLAESTGLQYFIVDESLQKGPGFASRLDSAFQYVFAKGFDRVLSIGNDCLGLTKTQILTAAHDLEQQDFVVGPTQRGGLYLFGLNFSAYQNLDFYTLPWQTKHLFSVLQQHLDSATYSVKTYERRYEVNFVYDWRAALHQLKHYGFLFHQINNLLAVLPGIRLQYLLPPALFHLFAIQQRGPPRIY